MVIVNAGINPVVKHEAFILSMATLKAIKILNK